MKSKLSYFCFFLALFFLIFKEYWVLFFFGNEAPLLKEMIYLSSGLLGVTLCCVSMNRLELFVLFLAVTAFLFEKNISFPLITLIVITSKGIKLDHIIRFYFFESLILFTIVLLFTSLGYMPSSSILDVRNVDGYDQIRYNLGFGGANGAFIYFFTIATSLCYILKNKYYKIFLYSILFLIIVVINFYTLSRTGFYSLIMMFLLIWVIPIKKINSNWVFKFCAKNSIVLFLLFSVVVATLFNTSKMNEILALRPAYWLAHLIQEVYTYNLWGHPWNDHYRELITSIPLDNSFLNMLLAKGIIFSVLTICFYNKGIKLLLQAEKYIDVSILITFLIFAFFENTLFVVGFNFSFFILYNSIRNLNKYEESNHSKNNSLLLVK